VFFGPRNHSPTDRPEHFAHANGAEALAAVWLAGDDLAPERRLLSALGATFVERTLRVPEDVSGTVARFSDGEVRLLPGSRRLAAGRTIVGASVRVRSLEVARHALAAGGIAVRERPEAPGSVFVTPADAHGLWLELVERR
jgi:catechol 2,3-dioxygenase-like lactoylglutathione lyase family enzyme